MTVEDLVDEAYRDPSRIRSVIERAFELGRAVPLATPAPPVVTDGAWVLAARLRRKARVVQEYDGRSALIEMADELEGRT